MDTHSITAQRRKAVWLDSSSGNFADFASLVDQRTRLADWPLAAEVAQNVLIYQGDAVRDAATNDAARKEMMAEWAEAFTTGPGIIVIRNALPDAAVVDRATEIFQAMIAEQHRTNSGGGDHFAKPGANDRIWNALEKHCLADPANFARYYAADALAMAAEAWLGAGYQMTAQVNRVNPGGAAQTAHRDYHLGFMSAAQMATYPAHIHGVSPLLTLQGAVAHCDMPVETGPTQFLPYSQRFFEGYLAFGRPEFQAHFAAHHVQLPLSKGDAMFFNPAVMHGAGHNSTTDVQRMANLLQVSSAFGRAMETVNRERMVTALYPVLLAGMADLSPREIANIIASSAEGYAFPTNLDRDPPIGGLAPKTQATRMAEALAQNVSPDAFSAQMTALAMNRQA
ncbi:MAG: phytanoyl-CoA dioxygenase family protein [Rhodobacteraceae bacterium]|nr:phytanoyl-CoA dioxygenase family protein [Paracoccaceae bacterium]MCF8513909.1 phytanoyl-CoA dioxygenase family protein [Paracoccaceae bacterium]MCF8518153.1 phytanoyl-CoA dioxygenase family protein [Paracoccaceae bacterium]